MDLVQSNPKLKLIYIALETPRRQIFDRLVAMMIGESVLTVRKQSEDEGVNQKILEATRDLMAFVRNNRLEIWDDQFDFDNIELLANLREEIKQHHNLVVVIDGLDHLKVSDHTELSDIHERRSSVILDLYKALDIPMFVGGELISSEEGLVGPRAYLRDSDAVYWLESKDGNMFLTVDSKRLGNNQLYQGTLSIDPASNRLQEEAETE